MVKILYYSKPKIFRKVFEILYSTPCNIEDEFSARIFLQVGLEKNSYSKFDEIMRGTNGN